MRKIFIAHVFAQMLSGGRPGSLKCQKKGKRRKGKIDGFVKSPSAALRFTFVAAAYLPSTPHSSGFARLASGAFYEAISLATFYEIIKISSWPQRNRESEGVPPHLIFIKESEPRRG
ncbi:MAG: hypothetical protein NTY64_14595 [Deltaproteobacteria bacterium]|nr:hypothetical protein [Deltaproteobacteria bacterium]